MAKIDVLISGLPASGKTTTAKALAVGLGLSCFDKDDILESLFAQLGVGDVQWRQKLSRESDIAFQRQVLADESAVVVSHWRQPGSRANSGTPTACLQQYFDSIVQVHCTCTPELAAQRFISRTRHVGHLDSLCSHPETLNRMFFLAVRQ